MGISKQFAEEDTDFNSVRTSTENNEIRMSPLHMKFSPLDGLFVLGETGKIRRRACECPVQGSDLLKTCTVEDCSIVISFPARSRNGREHGSCWDCSWQQ